MQKYQAIWAETPSFGPSLPGDGIGLLRVYASLHCSSEAMRIPAPEDTEAHFSIYRTYSLSLAVYKGGSFPCSECLVPHCNQKLWTYISTKSKIQGFKISKHSIPTPYLPRMKLNLVLLQSLAVAIAASPFSPPKRMLFRSP